MVADHVGDGSATIGASGTGSTALARLPQASDQVRAQFAPRHRIERGVDSCVTYLQRWFSRIHPTQYARDLFGGIALAQQTLHVWSRRPVMGQAQLPSGYPRDPIGTLVRQQRTISTCQRRMPALPWLLSRVNPSVSFQLTTDRARRAPDATSNCSQRAALLETKLDHRAFLTTQPFVVRSHGSTLPHGECCTS